MRCPWRTDIQCGLREDVLVLVAARARECDEQRRVGQRCARQTHVWLPLWAQCRWSAQYSSVLVADAHDR
eukprot:scaffold19920_cov61-Phaeocystis_antarctica.AAC.2